jgi:hypothetical protein
MRYLSPAFLFGEALQPPFDPKVIQRERKRLLADLELNGSDMLEVKGQVMTKNEIIDFFDALQNEAFAAYHAAVCEDAVLLRFLQDGELTWRNRFKDAGIYKDYGFMEWLSPFFFSAFTDFVTRCFETTDTIRMKAILENRLLMTNPDKERAWEFIVGILTKNISLFDHYRGRAQKHSPAPMPIEKVIDFLGHGYIGVIRELPDSRFAQLKDSYAFSIQHPAIATFNRDPKNRTLAVTWVEDAKDLAVSPDVKARVQNKLEELRGILSRQKKKANWGVIWLVIIGIRGIIALTNASSSSNRDDPGAYPTYTDPAPVVNPSKTIQMLDSVLADSLKRKSIPGVKSPS